MRSRRTIIVIAILAAVVLAFGAGLGAVLGRNGTSAAPPPPVLPVNPTIGPPEAAATTGTTGTAVGPPVSQADLRWVDFRGVRLPVSASAGPRQDPAGDGALGFADTPLGAVLAALHIIVRLDARFGPRVYRPTLTRQVTGPDKAMAVANVEASYTAHRRASGTPAGEPTGPVYVTLLGFRLDAFTSGWADVRLLLLGPADTPAGWAQADYRVGLRWLDGDWRLVAPPAGNWQAIVTVVPSTAGYTRFGG